MGDIAPSTTTPATGSDDILQRIENAVFMPEPVVDLDSEVEATAAAEKEITEVADSEVVEATETEAAEATETEVVETEAAEDEVELTTEDVANLLKIKPEYVQTTDDGELRIRTKVGDDVSHVSLEELVKGYQLEKHVTQKSQALYQDKQEFEKTKEAELGKLYKTMTDATAMVQTMEQQFMQDAGAVNLETLKVTDPARWAVKRQELADRQASIQQIKARMSGVIQEQTQAQQQQTTQQRKEFAAKEAEQLLATVPRWTDEAVANEEIPKMQSFLVESYGYKLEEIQTIPDHRMVLLALDAMKGRAVAKATVNPVIKKLKKLPKIVKSGKAGAKSQLLGEDKTKAKRIRLKQTGKVEDAAALIFDRL